MRHSGTDRRVARRTGHRVAGAGLLLALLLGCNDQLDPAIVPGLGPALSQAAATEGDAALGCPEAPDIRLREVPSDDELDGNRNGLVCDRNDGTAELPVITTHDDFMAGLE